MRLYLSNWSSLCVIVLIFVSLAGCAENYFVINEKSKSYEPGVGLTFEEYKKILPKGNLKVGFDIDDTLLFSSQATQLCMMQAQRTGMLLTDKNSMRKYCIEKIANKLCADGFEKPYKSVYGCMDDLSMPKIIANKLLLLHVERGDEIYIITARKSPSGVKLDDSNGKDRKVKVQSCDEDYEVNDREEVAESLQRAFNVEAEFLPPENIYFAGAPANKHDYISKLDLDYYFGDADTDITESLNAGSETKPIRILRSPASLSGTPANPGRYGEVVLLNSEY